MSGLKELRIRINSVKSTQKITKAMKLVAASKLRRAREQAEDARPYAERMGRMMQSLRQSVVASGSGPALLAGTGDDQTHLLVLITSDRGLCGALNSGLVRDARRAMSELQQQGKRVKVLAVGRKAYEQLYRELGDVLVGREALMDGKKLAYNDARRIATAIIERFDHGEFDKCTIFYNRFESAISQKVTREQLIPLPEEAAEGGAQVETIAAYEYEPGEQEVVTALLPKNLEVQIYHALLENTASEHGARMTAMDNATRNAGKMIDELTLKYNRSRQAAITTELTEIISGAEAL